MPHVHMISIDGLTAQDPLVERELVHRTVRLEESESRRRTSTRSILFTAIGRLFGTSLDIDCFAGV